MLGGYERMRTRKAIRKVLVFGIVFVLFFVAFAGIPVNVSAKFEGGTGTAANPYQVSTLDQLQDLDKNLNKHFILINNIDASATSTWNNGAGSKPIDLGNWNGFIGGFDGDGYVISNLFINRPSTDYIGLFHILGSGTIFDVGIVNADVTGGYYTGALVGWQLGAISNCHASGSVTGGQGVGMLVGAS
jgi:hypothetical protein